MLYAYVERFDVMDGRENILGLDGEVNKAQREKKGQIQVFQVQLHDSELMVMGRGHDAAGPTALIRPFQRLGGG
jgi:hypothetical protein